VYDTVVYKSDIDILKLNEVMVNGPDDVYVSGGADWEGWVAQAR
jgi:hypothetical protein